MKSMEGVRRVTNRMELVQGLKRNLLKARLTSMFLGLVVVVLAIAVAVLAKELKEVKQTVSAYETIERELNIENRDLEYELKEAKAEIKELNSFEHKIEIAFDLENIVREAVGGIEYVTKTLKYEVRKDYKIVTDITTHNYVLDEETGEAVKVIENKDHSFVVYIANKEAAKSLEQTLGKEYYYGTERYSDVINNHEDTLLVRHDIK